MTRHPRFGQSLATGSRSAKVRRHKLDATFTLSHRAQAGTIGVAVRSGKHELAGARAHQSRSSSLR